MQGARELPVDGLADGDERSVSVVVNSVAVHLNFDELAQARGQLGDQRLAKSCDPFDAQTEDLGGLGHGGQHFGCELTNACGQRLVSGDEDNAMFMGERVQELELLFVHRGQDVYIFFIPGGQLI